MLGHTDKQSIRHRVKGNNIYLFTGYEDNSNLFVHETETIPEAQPRVIVVVEGDKLAID